MQRLAVRQLNSFAQVAVAAEGKNLLQELVAQLQEPVPDAAFDGVQGFAVLQSGLHEGDHLIELLAERIGLEDEGLRCHTHGGPPGG